MAARKAVVRELNNDRCVFLPDLAIIRTRGQLSLFQARSAVSWVRSVSFGVKIVSCADVLCRPSRTRRHLQRHPETLRRRWSTASVPSWTVGTYPSSLVVRTASALALRRGTLKCVSALANASAVHLKGSDTNRAHRIIVNFIGDING